MNIICSVVIALLIVGIIILLKKGKLKTEHKTPVIVISPTCPCRHAGSNENRNGLNLLEATGFKVE